ncbi:hypothetical protein GCM10008107_19660 [Psychrosphaera saromensis]|uniref:Uncharacterized protein n=1 Tax=Psychrosphaera saromensis TaxID=716813 RepID=A0A2S7URV8_9GAMM|nr:hypothetical protein [Psychrosphaera saromensis]PQJ52667.1 hypothetical protein BTO11_02715 [Psychrosphaera saromensis]GHB70354.1 hypothetical protein GCM10008107_19660 [Psychrosphaera saromensis]GLQ13151.1 hypothetical protein GCM10007917_06060 [Psychrosphaera saromensis]
MNPKSNILCIFEGEKREVQYFKTLKNIYFSELSILVCSYGNDIYELFKELKEDVDLDIIELLRESKNVPENEKILEGYERDDFSQVFLFFDIECQDEQFNTDNLLSLIDIFSEETDNGKVFISYPMIEAIRDIPTYEEYLSHKVTVENCTGKKYKSLSVNGLQKFNDPRHNNKADWNQLVKINVEKGNYISLGTKGEFTKIPEQKEIAVKQIISISEENNIFVLSSYPLFVFHQKPSYFSF